MPRKRSEHVLGEGRVRRRWKVEDARVAVKRLEASGLSVREFAERYGLDRQRLYRWRSLLATPAPTRTASFIEIKPRATSMIEVVLRSGRVVRVPEGFSEETLRRVVASLEDVAESC